MHPNQQAMSSEPGISAVPERGRLDETPLPRLLLDLQQAKLSGSLVLRRARVEKRIQLRVGSPVRR